MVPAFMVSAPSLVTTLPSASRLTLPKFIKSLKSTTWPVGSSSPRLTTKPAPSSSQTSADKTLPSLTNTASSPQPSQTLQLTVPRLTNGAPLMSSLPSPLSAAPPATYTADLASTSDVSSISPSTSTELPMARAWLSSSMLLTLTASAGRAGMV